MAPFEKKSPLPLAVSLGAALLLVGCSVDVDEVDRLTRQFQDECLSVTGAYYTTEAIFKNNGWQIRQVCEMPANE